MAKTFQSRLQAKVNRINQKLIDNNIRLSGDITDVALIRAKKNDVGDVISRFVDSVDIIEIMMSPLRDIPMQAFSLDNPFPAPVAVDGVTQSQPITAFAPIDKKVDQDDLIVRFFENPSGQQPWILVLQVKDTLGTFGSRTIQWQKLNLSYYDNVLPQKIREYVVALADRRAKLGW